jgi:hypothetical protein
VLPRAMVTREPSETAHCAHPLVRHLGAPPELEGGEHSKAAHCSHTLVRQRIQAVALEVQRRRRRETSHQHARPLVGGILSQQQPHHQRVMARHPPSAHQPYRRRGLAPTPSVLRCTLLSSSSSTFLRGSSSSSVHSPAVTVSRRCCARAWSIAETGWRGSSPCVSPPPSARAGGGSRHPALPPLCGVPRVGGQSRSVHTRRAPPQQRVRRAATHIRRCWCSSDADHT